MGKSWEIPSWLGGYLYVVILCIWLLIVYPFGILLLLPYGWPLIWGWILASPLLACLLTMAKNRSHEKVFVDDLLPIERMEKAEETYVDEMKKVREKEAVDDWLETAERKMLSDYLEKTKQEKKESS